MRSALLALLFAGCAAPAAVVSEPIAPQQPAAPPAAPPLRVESPPGEPISQIGAHQPDESPELAIPEGAPAFVVTRLEATVPATRERWRLVEDGSRRVARLVLEAEKEPGTWVETGHAAWIGHAEKGGAIAFRLVDRSGAATWAPEHVDVSCVPTRACTEEKPAVKKPARKCEVTTEAGTEVVVLAAPGLEGTVTEGCAAPKVETVTPTSMRRGRRHDIDY